MKKKIFMMFVIMGLMMYIPSVMAVNVQGCGIIPNAQIDVKIANAVHSIILVIQIAVPVLLVIFGMLDLGKAVIASKEDEIKKGQQMLIKRLITAVIVFFVIAIVKLVIGFAADDSEGIMSCAKCFLYGADAKNGICK